MYKLLVVDDEPIIADAISETFKEMTNPEFDVYTAYSGSSALRYINESKINILLTDICMPKVDGFELQRQVSKKWPDCKIIFLTGYNDFEYIQSAMRSNSADYILKTEDKEVIVKSVLKAVKKIEEENNNKYVIEKAIENLKKAIPIMQKEFFGELLDGWKYSREDLKRNFIELGIELESSKPVIMLVGRVDYFQHRGSMSQRMKTIFGVQDVVKQLLGGDMHCVSALYGQYKMVWLIQPSKVSAEKGLEDKDLWGLSIQNIYDTLESVQKKCMQLFNVPTSFILNDTPVYWEDIASTYGLLDFKLNCNFKFANQAILIYSNDINENVKYNTDADDIQVRNSIKKIGYLSTLLECGQEKRYNKLLDEIVDSVGSVKHNSYKYKNEVYYSLAAMFLSYINRSDIAFGLEQRMELDKLSKMDMHTSWEEAVLFFKELSSTIFELERDQDTQKGQSLIFEVQEYIRKNIGKDITLTQLSRVFHFNASYFSRLYKSLTGENITEFITRVRLNKAKELLEDRDLKINEIAERLGFKTPSYFTNFFKKNTNMTPQKYRDTVLKNM